MFEFDLLPSPPNTAPPPGGFVFVFLSCWSIPRPLTLGQHRFKQFPTTGPEGLDLSRGLPEGMATSQTEPDGYLRDPTTVFCKLSVRRSKCCLEFFII